MIGSDISQTWESASEVSHSSPPPCFVSHCSLCHALLGLISLWPNQMHIVVVGSVQRSKSSELQGSGCTGTKHISALRPLLKTPSKHQVAPNVCLMICWLLHEHAGRFEITWSCNLPHISSSSLWVNMLCHQLIFPLNARLPLHSARNIRNNCLRRSWIIFHIYCTLFFNSAITNSGRIQYACVRNNCNYIYIFKYNVFFFISSNTQSLVNLRCQRYKHSVLLDLSLWVVN